LVLNLFGPVSYASQTWSIGAEEQFYLVWPFLMKYIKNKWVLMFGVIFGYIFIKFSFHLLPRNEFITIFNGYWISTPIHCMAIGGIFALLIYTNSSTIKFIRKQLFAKSTQVIVLAATTFSIAIGFNFPHFNDEFYATLWGILISNFAANKNRLFSMENALSNYLGKISYGLYMFHPIVIVFSIKTLEYINIENDFILYPLVLIVLIVVSALSYEFFENIFINKKVKYSTILSGANATEK
jgi:peptidoglycan/LPS O-acetylase OafA/YrhL